MSSKSKRNRPCRQDRHREYSESDGESDSDRESKRHHHRRERQERRDHRSRSHSRSPGHHRKNKSEKHSSRNHKERNHSRDEDHKTLKHRDQDNVDKRKERHREEKIREDRDEHRETHRRRDGDHDTGRSGRSKNGNHKEKEELPKIPLRGKWENDPGAESDDPQDRVRAPPTNQGAAQQTSQIRIKQERDLNDARRTQDANRKSQNPFESQSLAAGPAEQSDPPPEKEKPNFGVSGKLTEDANTYRGVVIKYNEPPEARKPKRKWRFYVFKGEEELPVVHIHRQSAYLLGRERLIADLPIDHPSCSKQHAVLQYRLVEFERPDGTMGKRVRPYLIDLESSNGTYINNNRIEGKRYYELKEKDVVKFGYSTREYVLLHDKSKDSDLDEDQAD